MDDPVSESAYYLVACRGETKLTLVQHGGEESPGVVQIVWNHRTRWWRTRQTSPGRDARPQATGLIHESATA